MTSRVWPTPGCWLTKNVWPCYGLNLNNALVHHWAALMQHWAHTRAHGHDAATMDAEFVAADGKRFVPFDRDAIEAYADGRHHHAPVHLSPIPSIHLGLLDITKANDASQGSQVFPTDAVRLSYAEEFGIDHKMSPTKQNSCFVNVKNNVKTYMTLGARGRPAVCGIGMDDRKRRMVELLSTEISDERKNDCDLLSEIDERKKNIVQKGGFDSLELCALADLLRIRIVLYTMTSRAKASLSFDSDAILGKVGTNAEGSVVPIVYLLRHDPPVPSTLGHAQLQFLPLRRLFPDADADAAETLGTLLASVSQNETRDPVNAPGDGSKGGHAAQQGGGPGKGAKGGEGSGTDDTAKVKKDSWAPPKKVKLGEREMPADKRIAILVPETHLPQMVGVERDVITRGEYEAHANQAKTVTGGIGGDYNMVQRCVSDLRFLKFFPSGDGTSAAETSHLPFFAEGAKDNGEVSLHPLHRPLAIFVAHLALALKIAPEHVEERFIFVSHQSLGPLDTPLDHDPGPEEKNLMQSFQDIVAEYPIFVFHGHVTMNALDFNGTEKVMERELPCHRILTYPPLSIAKLGTPTYQARFLGEVWDKIVGEKWRPLSMTRWDPSQELGHGVGHVDPAKGCTLYLVGYYYPGDGPSQPAGWRYDLVSRNDDLTAIVYYWRGGDKGSIFGKKPKLVSLSPEEEGARPGVEIYEMARMTIVYPLPLDAFPGPRHDPAFGRVIFVNIQTMNKGPQLIHLEFPRPDSGDESILCGRTDWWAPTRKRKKPKGKAPLKEPYLREMCQVISEVLLRHGYCHASQVFRVDFVYSTRKPCFYPLAVMGLPYIPDGSALPFRVQMETAHAMAKLVTAHFHDRGEPWPR